MSDNEKDTGSIPSLVGDDISTDGTTLYKYRDFGNVPEDQEVETSPSPSPSPSSRGGGGGGGLESSIRVQKFPVKLYAILAQKEFTDIITWMPHGRSWKVLKPNLFESLVMPLFFEYSNYHSFNRLVNAWSFRRISSGPDRGSYYHELFLRGKPHLQKYMRRLPKTHKKLPMKKEDEPDFYSYDKAQPLPSLEEVPLTNSNHVMQPIRNQQGLGSGVVNSLSPNAVSCFPSLQSTKDAFDSRDNIVSLAQSRSPTNFVSSVPNMNVNDLHGMSNMNTMNMMNNMSSMNSMNGMNNMGGMNGMNNMNGMGGMNTMNTMNTMNGMNSVNTMNGMNNMNGMGSMNGMNSMNGMGAFNMVESKFSSQSGMGDFGSAFSPQPSKLDQIQRLRQLQQMQLFDRQMGNSQMSLGTDPFAMIQAENAMALRVNRQQC